MENNFKITIPKPCKEDWHKMTTNEQGKFCKVCDKTVVDFSKMNDEELKRFFTDKLKVEKICGHFKTSQITATIPKLHHFLIKMYNDIEEKLLFRFLKIPVLMAISGLMFLAGCGSRTTGEKMPANTTDTIAPELPANEKYKMGVSPINFDSTKKEILPKGKNKIIPPSPNIITTEIETTQVRLMGEMLIESPADVDSAKNPMN